MASNTAIVIGLLLNICLVASQGLWPRQLPSSGTFEPSLSADNPTPLNFDQGPEQKDPKGVKGVNPPTESPKSVKATRFLDGMDLLDGLDSFGPYMAGSFPLPNLPSAMSYLVF